MTIYQHRATVTTVGGSTSSTTLKILGGLLRQVFVKANTDTTVFRVRIDDTSVSGVLSYGYHNGELNDTGNISKALPLPVSGEYVVNITNASPNDIFTVLLSVEE